MFYYILAGLSIASAYQQSQAAELQGEYQKRMFDMNSRLAKMNAEESIKKGDETASIVRQKGAQVKGEQRAALAAQGIDINTGSASDVQAQTEQNVALDVLAVKNNAWREAWGYRTQAEDYSSRSRMAGRIAETEQRASLIGGGMRALEYGYKGYKDKNK